MFDEKMREPGEGVTDDQTKRKINPVAAADDPHEQNDAERRADEMQIPRQRLAVLGNVKIPKFRISFNPFVICCHNLSPRCRDCRFYQSLAVPVYRKKKKLATDDDQSQVKFVR